MLELSTPHLRARLTPIGAALSELYAPDRQGTLADVVLGYDGDDAYLRDTAYLGVVVGRVANRIGNATFALDGERYTLAANEGPHHLHGGPDGFHRRTWDVLEHDEDAVTFALVSPDGDQGYPGQVHCQVRYALAGRSLDITMTATATRATPLWLAHHAYWNLGGHDRGPIGDHALQIDADQWLPTDVALIPTGEIAKVDGALDFRRPRSLGGQACDHAFVLRGRGHRRAATLHGHGRTMTLLTDAPALQLYTGDKLPRLRGKNGARYGPRQGLCLEAQAHPDAINHRGQPGWPDVVLRPGETWRQRVTCTFG